MDDWLLQEYLERCKPLDQGIGLPEADARWFFQQLVLGLDFCHRLGIAHQVGGLHHVCSGPQCVMQPERALSASCVGASMWHARLCDTRVLRAGHQARECAAGSCGASRTAQAVRLWLLRAQ